MPSVELYGNRVVSWIATTTATHVHLWPSIQLLYSTEMLADVCSWAHYFVISIVLRITGTKKMCSIAVSQTNCHSEVLLCLVVHWHWEYAWIALGKVSSKFTYTLQAFSTPRVHLGACARLAGYLFRCVTIMGWNNIMDCYGHMEKLQLSDTCILRHYYRYCLY